MKSTKLFMNVPDNFDYLSAATSYGWVVLSPTQWMADKKSVVRIEQLSSSQCVKLIVSGAESGLVVSVAHEKDLSKAERVEIEQKVSTMFRLEHDFSEFYDLCSKQGKQYECIVGKGHLMRAPTVFEDIVKTICTTNTTWSGTKRMVANLVAVLGEPLYSGSTEKAFPTPEKIAVLDEYAEIGSYGLGYRAAYIQELAQRVVTGDINIERWVDSKLPTGELRKELLKVKGIGAYAASTMLMLLGRYDYLAVDSEMRSFVKSKYFSDKDDVPDRELQAVYESWGKWKYLAYWFDDECEKR